VEAADAINTRDYPVQQNPKIGKNAASTEWLNGDEILALIAADNPDGPDTPADWIYGPSNLDYFYTFFAQTMASPAHRGIVHIMIVNTGLAQGPTMGGVHWFVVAWIIDP